MLILHLSASYCCSLTQLITKSACNYACVNSHMLHFWISWGNIPSWWCVFMPSSTITESSEGGCSGRLKDTSANSVIQRSDFLRGRNHQTCNQSVLSVVLFGQGTYARLSEFDLWPSCKKISQVEKVQTACRFFFYTSSVFQKVDRTCNLLQQLCTLTEHTQKIRVELVPENIKSNKRIMAQLREMWIVK